MNRRISTAIRIDTTLAGAWALTLVTAANLTAGSIGSASRRRSAITTTANTDEENRCR
jgi:hypothetical protein